jgi:RNA polymerase sigma-70 factor, ECF subfamily
MEDRLAHSKDEKELGTLMMRAQAGDVESYRTLLRRIQELLQPFIGNTLARMGHGYSGSVDDIVQETLLAIHVKRGTYDPDQYFLPWLYAIARYKLVDYLRASRNYAKMIPHGDDAVDLTASPFSGTSQLDAERLLSALPEKQKALLTMVKLDGLSIQEAALKSGFSPSDVKVSIHRGMKKLREKLKGVKSED